jgi:hypothetical protein
VTETITSEEIGYLLGLAAARDQRTVGDADILAWHADLNAARVTLRAAEAALTHYYAVITPRMDPEHRHRVNAPDLLAIIRKARADRANTGTLVYDGTPGETGAQYLASRQQMVDDIASGRTQNQPARAAIGPAPSAAVAAGLSYTEEDIKAMRMEGDLKRIWKAETARASETCARRKALVLRYPDLAERLTEPPLSYARPECWNGGLGTGSDWAGRPNTSPSYLQLAAIVAEAEQRAATTHRPAA